MNIPFFNYQIIKLSNHQISSILFAILLWLIMLSRFGYEFGTNDQVEILPYSVYLHDHSLYQEDFFIQSLDSVQPNERTVLAFLLSLFTSALQPLCFLLQFLCSFFLFLGMENISKRFINNSFLARLAVLLCFIPFYNWTLGDCELYYNQIQGSNIAKAIGIWVIVSFLDGKFMRSFVLLSIATFFQIIVGLDLAIILGLILLMRYFIHHDVSKREVLMPFSIFALTAGIYLLLIFFNRPSGGSLSGGEYFDLMFRFRHPHHFIFSSFPMIKRIFFVMLMFAATYYFSKKNRTVFYFITIGSVIMLLYIIAVDYLHITFIANFQWFKNTIWMKFFGILAVVALIEDKMKLNEKFLLLKKKQAIVFFGFSILLFSALVFRFNYLLPFETKYHFGNQIHDDPLISICDEIRNSTSKNAVFIQPFEITELKYYSQRSSFVDFKANVRDPLNAGEWYSRIQLVYGISIQDKLDSFALQDNADDFFIHQSLIHYETLKNYGVTHVLTYASHIIPGKDVILKNAFYKVYEL